MTRSATHLKLCSTTVDAQAGFPRPASTAAHSPVQPSLFHEVNLELMLNMIGQIVAIERQHGEDVALAVVEDLKRIVARPHLTLVQ